MGNQVCLPSLLRFITGMSSIPPMGVKFSIEILYHVNDDNVLPSASACTHKLFLPVCHCSEDAFFSSFKTALEFGSSFGLC